MSCEMEDRGFLLTDDFHEGRLHGLGYGHAVRAERRGQHGLRPVQQRLHVPRDSLAPAQTTVEVHRSLRANVVRRVQRSLQR